MPDTAPVIRLSHYTPPAYLVERVALTFALHPTQTRVTSRIRFVPNPAVGNEKPPLRLDGVGLRLIRAQIDGVDVDPSALATDAMGLNLAPAALPDGAFEWLAEVEIDPQSNTALEGLYMSKGMFCTQCEAEGFRKITYYPDRPDVMAPYTVRIESDLPVMLSNGNPVASGPGWAEWHDPWPKPSYLFALVAGNLVPVDDSFVTASGRPVQLRIWVRAGDRDKCSYAMDALKRSMAWDEQVYGREYDLDIFQIVAVDDFNMGAMENKGLNIFNSKYVLASPETATDTDYALIEGIIAHEYFHNWTGNRITCRDWFQLCLKEGLTVYRDQQFSSDQRSAPVKRIADVRNLRARQFREDAGPLAHPVRPDAYVEINNFYTATVYEKGAEVIRMLHHLVGDDMYRQALDLYFTRHDGHACTIEDWLSVFHDVSGRDLTGFMRWYTDAGTPHLHVTDEWNGERYRLHLRQHTRPTPGQPDKPPRVIPVAYGLIGEGGRTLSQGVIEMTESSMTMDFILPERPVPSLLRGFSAPVIVHRDTTQAERIFLLAHDTDPFNRWEAGRALALEALVAAAQGDPPDTDAQIDALGRLITDTGLDPAFRALALDLPDDDEIATRIAEDGQQPDPQAIYHARRRLALAMATRLEGPLRALHDARPDGPYAPDAEQAGRRALANAALGLLARNHPDLAQKAYDGARNMTDRMAALAALVRAGAAEEAIYDFYTRWSRDALVLDKWFALQAAATPPDAALGRVRALATHPDFDWKNPNRFRALIGAFSANHAAFHHLGGSGYALLADWVIKLDSANPQTAARTAKALETWARYPGRKHARAALARIAAAPGLSRDTAEMVGKMLES